MKRTKCPVCGKKLIHAKHREWYEKWRKRFDMLLYTEQQNKRKHTPAQLKAFEEIKIVLCK